MIQTTRIIAVSVLLLWSMTVAAQELAQQGGRGEVYPNGNTAAKTTLLDGYGAEPP